MHFLTAANAYATGTEIIKYLTFLIFEIQDSITINFSLTTTPTKQAVSD